MALTGVAWGVWAGAGAAGVVQLTIVYVFGHFLAFSLTFATMAYFLVGKFLGPGIAGLPKRRRQTGLFIAANERETLEFGYCFDVRMFDILAAKAYGTGIDTSFLSGLGASLCAAIHYSAAYSRHEHVGVSLML